MMSEKRDLRLIQIHHQGRQRGHQDYYRVSLGPSVSREARRYKVLQASGSIPVVDRTISGTRRGYGVIIKLPLKIPSPADR